MAGRSKAGKAKQKAGRKLDALLFGIPENRAKFMRTGKTNPAPKKRALYRLGYAAGKRNPANPGDALVSVERTVVFREAAVGGLEDARSFFLAGYADGAGEKRNPKAGRTGRKAKCAKRNGPKVKRNGRPAVRNPRNPADTAQAAFEGFHGEKSKKTIVVQERRHFHTHVWALGPLVLLKVKLPSDRRQAGLKNIVEIEFDYEGKNPVFVTANEKRNQMFFDGGDQSVNVKTFGVPPEPHEKVVLGEVSDAWYFTTKKHLGKDGGTAIYKHKLGEEGGELPTLLYHTIDKRLELAGGSYTIPNEGVRN